MYLERMPRYKNATAKDVAAVDSYIDWMRAKDRGSEYANGTFKEWCGRDEIPSEDYVSFYSQFYEEKFQDWDVEKKHGWYRISEEVGYWRKCNQIHAWFVENVQDGIDDCDYHREVTKEDLEELLDTCRQVLSSCDLADGEINDGWEFVNGQRVPRTVQGKYVKDPSIAKALLPTTSGFFFGDTNYDEYYVKDLINTMEIITRVLDTTDFETQMIYYVSSW